MSLQLLALGSTCVSRGGGWYYDLRLARVASRYGLPPSSRSLNLNLSVRFFRRFL